MKKTRNKRILSYIESQQEELVEVKRTIPYEPGISIHFAAINQLLMDQQKTNPKEASSQ